MAILIATNFGEFTADTDVFVNAGGSANFSTTLYNATYSNGQGKTYNWGVSSSGGTLIVPAHSAGVYHALCFRGTFTAGVGFIRLEESGTAHLNVIWNSDGTFTIQRLSTTIAGPSTQQYTGVNVGVHLEFSYNIHDSTGYAHLKANGVQILTFTGDTRNAGTGIINNLRYDATSTPQSMTDLVVVDTTGSAPFNAALGPVRVVNSFTASNGGSGQAWTPLSGTNASMIDDPLNVHDGDATYNETATPGAMDWFTYPPTDFNNMSGTILGVVYKFVARTPDLGTHTMRTNCKKGGTTVNGTTISQNATYGAPLFDVYPNDPSTAAAWADFNAIGAAEFGYEMVS